MPIKIHPIIHDVKFPLLLAVGIYFSVYIISYVHNAFSPCIQDPIRSMPCETELDIKYAMLALWVIFPIGILIFARIIKRLYKKT